MDWWVADHAGESLHLVGVTVLLAMVWRQISAMHESTGYWPFQLCIRTSLCKPVLLIYADSARNWLIVSCGNCQFPHGLPRNTAWICADNLRDGLRKSSVFHVMYCTLLRNLQLDTLRDWSHWLLYTYMCTVWIIWNVMKAENWQWLERLMDNHFCFYQLSVFD